MKKIIEYRRYDPIPAKPIVVAIDEAGDSFTLSGEPWLVPEGVKLKLFGILSAQEFARLRAKPSTEP